LYRDELELARFQSGLIFANDVPKPSLRGYLLPFAQMRRRGFQTVVWGQVRGPHPGRKVYRLEILHKSRWQPIGRARLTNENGFFVRSIRLKRGSLLRVFSPRQKRYSLQLRIR